MYLLPANYFHMYLASASSVTEEQQYGMLSIINSLPVVHNQVKMLLSSLHLHLRILFEHVS